MDVRSLDAVRHEYAKAAASSPLLFASTEWLTAVGAAHVQILCVELDGGEVYLPVRLARRRGVLSIENPPLTPWLYPVGPGLDKTSAHSRIAAANKIGTAIAKALPSNALIKLRLHWSFPSPLGFHWEGFLTFARVSYRIEKTDRDSAWTSLKGELRTDVRKAERNGVKVDPVVDDLRDIAAFFDAQAAAVGYEHPLDRSELALFLRRVVDGGCGRVLTATCDGEVVAAALVAQDTVAGYYLLAASSDHGRRVKAMPILTWHAVAAELDAGRAFDFAGSMLPGVEHYNRSFGGTQVLDPLLFRPPFGQGALRLVSRLAGFRGTAQPGPPR